MMRTTTIVQISGVLTGILIGVMLAAVLLFYYRPTVEYAHVTVDMSRVWRIATIVAVGSIFGLIVWLRKRNGHA
jgi:hypothetical protein